MTESCHSEARLGSRVRKQQHHKAVISQTGIEHNLWVFVFVIIIILNILPRDYYNSDMSLCLRSIVKPNCIIQITEESVGIKG